MDKPLCPICDLPIDFITHDKKTFQIVSYRGKWSSRLFSDPFEASEWMRSFDLKKAMFEAVEDHKGKAVRLVGKGWQTSFMTQNEMVGWKAILATETPEPKRRKKEEQ